MRIHVLANPNRHVNDALSILQDFGLSARHLPIHLGGTAAPSEFYHKRLQEEDRQSQQLTARQQWRQQLQQQKCSTAEQQHSWIDALFSGMDASNRQGNDAIQKPPSNTATALSKEQFTELSRRAKAFQQEKLLHKVALLHCQLQHSRQRNMHLQSLHEQATRWMKVYDQEWSLLHQNVTETIQYMLFTQPDVIAAYKTNPQFASELAKMFLRRFMIYQGRVVATGDLRFLRGSVNVLPHELVVSVPANVPLLEGMSIESAATVIRNKTNYDVEPARNEESEAKRDSPTKRSMEMEKVNTAGTKNVIRDSAACKEKDSKTTCDKDMSSSLKKEAHDCTLSPDLVCAAEALIQKFHSRPAPPIPQVPGLRHLFDGLVLGIQNRLPHQQEQHESLTCAKRQREDDEAKEVRRKETRAKRVKLLKRL